MIVCIEFKQAARRLCRTCQSPVKLSRIQLDLLISRAASWSASGQGQNFTMSSLSLLQSDVREMAAFKAGPRSENKKRRPTMQAVRRYLFLQTAGALFLYGLMFVSPASDAATTSVASPASTSKAKPASTAKTTASSSVVASAKASQAKTTVARSATAPKSAVAKPASSKTGTAKAATPPPGANLSDTPAGIRPSSR